jgi:hypothetical protein
MPMIESMGAMLVGMGVDASQVTHEGFPGYELPH